MSTKESQKVVCYTNKGSLPSILHLEKGGAQMFDKLVTLIIAPLFVALATLVADHWLNDQDND